MRSGFGFICWSIGVFTGSVFASILTAYLYEQRLGEWKTRRRL